MRVCVFGAGAIGGHLAARLAEGGAEVSVVARGAVLEAIRRNGLAVTAADREMRCRPAASDDPAALGRQDAVVVTVKAPALPAVAAGIGKLLGPDTPVAFVMNGIPWWYFHAHGGALDGRRLPRIDPGDALWREVGPERALGGVVWSACTVVAPGVVEVASPTNRVVLGEPDGSLSPRAEALAGALRRGGMGGEVSPQIRREVWRKLLQNLSAGPLALLAHAPLGTVLADPACEAAARRLFAEAQAVAAAMGCAVPVDADAAFARTRGSPHKPSILQDLELGRPMEVDALYTVPQEMARLAGVATPTLDLVAALIRMRAAGAGLYAG